MPSFCPLFLEKITMQRIPTTAALAHARSIPALRRLVQAGCAALMLATAFQAAAQQPAKPAQQTLKVGATAAGVPFTFLNTKTNAIEGVMVDVITEVGKRAGFNVQIEPMAFPSLVAALTSSKIDIISAAMYITPARKEVIDFSDPIYTYGEGLMVPTADTRNYATFDDLKGSTVGVQIGTAYVDVLKKTNLFAEVKVYETIADVMRDVNAGRIKAGFADYPIAAYFLKEGKFPDVRMVSGYKSTMTGSLGIGVRKTDPELLKKVNAGLKEITADGTLKKILTKWGL